jgi:hypothetical protein
MSTTISDFKTRLAQKIHGQSINKVQDINGLISEAAGNLLLQIDPMETKRVTQVTNGLYDQVYSILAPTDLKKDRIIDIRPQTNQNPSNNFHQIYGADFTAYKTNNSFDVEYNTGVKTIRVSKALQAGIMVNAAASLTDNGTWAAGGNAINLTTDTVNKMYSSASIKFDISASGADAYIENSTMTQVDATNYVNVGSFFAWVYIPSITIITSITLRWGNDSSNYYSASATTAQDSTAFIVGWNLVRFDWSGATETGSVTDTTIDYLRVTFNYSGTATTGCRVNSIMLKLPIPYEIVYYSSYLFRNSSGTWIPKPTSIDDSDLVNLDDDSINLLLYEASYLVAQELQGEDAVFDTDFWQRKKKEVWDMYGGKYKSETKNRRSTYYSTVRRRF